MGGRRPPLYPATGAEAIRADGGSEPHPTYGRAGLIAPPSLDSGDDKVLLGLLPRQHHPFARTRKVGHFPQACRPPAEFRAQHRHPYRGRAQSGVVKIKGLIFPWEKIGSERLNLTSGLHPVGQNRPNLAQELSGREHSDAGGPGRLAASSATKGTDHGATSPLSPALSLLRALKLGTIESCQTQICPHLGPI